MKSVESILLREKIFGMQLFIEAFSEGAPESGTIKVLLSEGRDSKSVLSYNLHASSFTTQHLKKSEKTFSFDIDACTP